MRPRFPFCDMSKICWKTNVLKTPPTSVVTTGAGRSWEAQAAAALGRLAPHLLAHVQRTSSPLLGVQALLFFKADPGPLRLSIQKHGHRQRWEHMMIKPVRLLNELAVCRVETCLRGGVEYNDIDLWCNYVTLGQCNTIKLLEIRHHHFASCCALSFWHNEMVITVLSSATETLSISRAVSCLVIETKRKKTCRRSQHC